MGHASVYYSHPRKNSKGARKWYVSYFYHRHHTTTVLSSSSSSYFNNYFYDGIIRVLLQAKPLQPTTAPLYNNDEQHRNISEPHRS
jgi:hypothetical protein